MASFHGWTRLNETSFLLKVQKSSGFQKCIGNYSKAFGVPLDDNNLQSFAEEMCKCCLREADDVMFDDNQGPLAAALQEVQHYKQKLIECNLTAMKQIAAMRDGCHLSEFLQEDAVTFHEPLTYMDEHQQRLVIAVVCDKVRQLQSGTAPPSLVEALTRYAEELLRQEEGATAPMDDLLEVQSGLQKVRVQKKAVQARLEHAESESTNLRKELEDRARAKHIKTRFCMCCMMLHVLCLFCKTKCWWWFCLNRILETCWNVCFPQEVKSNLADTSKAYEVLKEQEPTWQESLEELRDLSEHQKAELEQDRLHIEHLMAALETRDKMIQDHTEEKQQLEEDLKSERETTASLQEQLTDAQTAAAQQQGQIEDMRCTIRGMQIELSCFEQKCSQQQLDNEQLQEELKQMEEVRICERQRLEEELEVIYQHHAMVVEESNAMRAELDRRNNTETQETQTETTASVLEEQLADANKLRVMIEELQMRFRDVLEKYRHRFGSDAKEVAIETGMDDFLRSLADVMLRVWVLKLPLVAVAVVDGTSIYV